MSKHVKHRTGPQTRAAFLGACLISLISFDCFSKEVLPVDHRAPVPQGPSGSRASLISLISFDCFSKDRAPSCRLSPSTAGRFGGL